MPRFLQRNLCPDLHQCIGNYAYAAEFPPFNAAWNASDEMPPRSRSRRAETAAGLFAAERLPSPDIFGGPGSQGPRGQNGLEWVMVWQPMASASGERFW